MNDTFTILASLVGVIGTILFCVAGALLIDRRNQRDLAIARLTARYRIEQEDEQELEQALDVVRKRHLESFAPLLDDVPEESGVRCVDDEEPITQRTVGT